MKVAIVYHKEDMDGRMAKELACNAMTYHDHQYTCFGMTNASKFLDLNLLLTFDTVIVLDYSLQPDDMQALYRSGKLIWIDHHAYAIEQGRKDGYTYANAPGLRHTSISAACLAYKHWQTTIESISEAVWPIVQLVDIYDLWNTESEYFDKAKALNAYFMTLSEHDFSMLFDSILDHETPGKLIEYGAKVGKHILASRNSYAHALAYPHTTTLEGHKVVAYNYVHNDLSAEVEDDTICMMYVIQGSYAKVSLRQNGGTIDVAAIARNYGGGGHRQAAGMTIPTYTLMTILNQPNV